MCGVMEKKQTSFMSSFLVNFSMVMKSITEYAWWAWLPQGLGKVTGFSGFAIFYSIVSLENDGIFLFILCGERSSWTIYLHLKMLLMVTIISWCVHQAHYRTEIYCLNILS